MGQRLFLNLARRADGDDAAFVDDGHAVAEFLRLFDVVGGEEDGALLTAQVQHEFVDFEAGLGVEAGGGLVEKEHLRGVEQGQRQSKPLLLSAGEFAVLRVALLPELQALQELVAIHGARVESVEELHGLVDLDLLLEVGGLQADADAVLELAGLHLGIAAEDADASAGAGAQPFEDFYGGGLTGAIGAEQAEDFAGAHFEIDALDGGKAAVTLAEGFHLDGIVHEFSSLSQAGGKGQIRETRGQPGRSRVRRGSRTATRSVTRVDVRIAGSGLPIAVSVIVAATGTRTIAPAEGNADADAKVRTGPETSTVVIASARVEAARIVAASCAAVSGPGVAARAGIAAARVGGGIAAPTGIAASCVG